MTIKDLKTITASATTYILYFCNDKKESIDGVHSNCIYSSIYDTTFDEYNIFSIYPAGKDNLEVWIDKKGMFSLIFSNITEEQIDIVEDMLKALNIKMYRKNDVFIFTDKKEYTIVTDLLDKTMINYEEHII